MPYRREVAQHIHLLLLLLRPHPTQLPYHLHNVVHLHCRPHPHHNKAQYANPQQLLEDRLAEDVIGQTDLSRDGRVRLVVVMVDEFAVEEVDVERELPRVHQVSCGLVEDVDWHLDASPVVVGHGEYQDEEGQHVGQGGQQEAVAGDVVLLLSSSLDKVLLVVPTLDVEELVQVLHCVLYEQMVLRLPTELVGKAVPGSHVEEWGGSHRKCVFERGRWVDGKGRIQVCSGLAIIMNQFSPASENFFLSPLLCEQHDHSPYLSPFPNPYNHHPQPADLEDLLHFQLDEPPIPLTHKKGDLEGEEEDKCGRGEAVEESSEANEPANTPEAPTENVEAKLEEASPSFLTHSSPKGDSEISNLIEFLVEHSQLGEESLEVQGQRLSGGNLSLLGAFRLLAGKFRRLRKTKQEMTKYCLRKAFKFIAASRHSPARDLDHCMQQYFEHAGGNFSFPFKKHSSQKTMNATFLKRIFQCHQFAEDYSLFLENFPAMVAEDNSKKVRYLAELVREALEKGDVEAVGKIKRLPWTAVTLQQVIELATTMPELAPVRFSRRRSIE